MLLLSFIGAVMNLPPEDQLLSRDSFRELCFARDNGRCVLCGAPAVDAHHVMERRLFADGGYYLGNGASVCEACHLRCERTEVTLEQVREAAGIRKYVIPPHLYDDADQGSFDKWANIILPNGQRLQGELFHDESVQKVLREGGVLHLFTNRIKYPRTFHVPFSPGVGKDDRVLDSFAAFEGRRVIVTIKNDGENSSIYSDGYVHARSLETESHPSRNRLRALAAVVGPQLPAGWRLCGENLFAKHAIHYQHLRDHFEVFSLWDDRNICRSWDETTEWAELLDLQTVPVLYDGPFDLDILKSLYRERDQYGDEMEGWVLRVADAFSYGEFKTHVAKYVRAGHVPLHGGHWKRAPVIPNVIDPATRS